MAVEIFLKPQVVDFLDVGKAVEVNMVQGEIASIFPDYYEGGTEGIFLDAQTIRHAEGEFKNGFGFLSTEGKYRFNYQ
ncbi:unnamed protein product [marine sediment metagenome]|uniref:Uncharacterized protein n=1 Tax=marine sediment metagenome TaxID=412755 RepID=X1LJN1_9ZZZZ